MSMQADTTFAGLAQESRREIEAEDRRHETNAEAIAKDLGVLCSQGLGSEVPWSPRKAIMPNGYQSAYVVEAEIKGSAWQDEVQNAFCREGLCTQLTTAFNSLNVIGKERDVRIERSGVEGDLRIAIAVDAIDRERLNSLVTRALAR